MLNRRDWIQSMVATLSLATPSSGVMQQASSGANSGATLPALFFPQHFGARADGVALDSQAINAAIDRATAGGGGTVYLAPGIYRCGTVILKSRVTLYLEAGAVLLGSKQVNDYTPQPGPALNEDAGQRHLIFAKDVEDVTLCGPGLIDGQGKSFWQSSGRQPRPSEEHWRDVATYDYKPMARVSPMLELVNCKRLRVEQLRIENSAGWTMRLINCNGVVVDGIAIKNPIYGPNVDGIDVSNSSNVRIANCLIDTADDAICLKSQGPDPYSSDIPVTRNIVVTNCILSCCCNAFKFGTGTSGGFENITFSNSVIFNDDVDLNARVIAGIAIEMVDGGWVEGVNITGIRMQRTRTPIFLRLGNRHPRPDGKPGTMRGVMISDIQATGAVLTNSIMGIPGAPVEDVTLSNIRLDSDEEGKLEWVNRAIPEVIPGYPESRMFGRLPAYGFFCRHMRGLRMHDVVLGASTKEQRPAIVCEDVEQFELDGLRTRAVVTASPTIKLTDAHDVWIRSGRSVPGSPAYLSVSGTSSRVLLSECDLRDNPHPVQRSSEVPSGAVLVSPMPAPIE